MSDVIDEDFKYFNHFINRENQFILRIHAQFDFNLRKAIGNCPDTIQILQVYEDQSRCISVFKPWVNKLIVGFTRTIEGLPLTLDTIEMISEIEKYMIVPHSRFKCDKGEHYKYFGLFTTWEPMVGLSYTPPTPTTTDDENQVDDD